MKTGVVTHTCNPGAGETVACDLQGSVATSLANWGHSSPSEGKTRWVVPRSGHLLTHICICTQACSPIHSCAYIHVNSLIHTHTHRHAHIYTHVHRHTYTLSYIHMCTQTCSPIHSSINTHKDLTSAGMLTSHFHLVPCAWLSAAGGDCLPSIHIHQHCKRSGTGSVLQSKENAIPVTQGPQVLGCPLIYMYSLFILLRQDHGR